MSELTLRARFLEDLFFRQQDELLIAKRRELERMEHTRKALAEASGIANPAVLDALVALDVAPDLVASLAVVPLVEVAWADGHVDPRERDAILTGAAGTGMGKGSVDYALLAEWLKHQPPAKLMKAWTHYVEGLCEKLGDAERQALRHDLLDRARAVAEAAGGFLGLISKVSAQEREVLAKLESAFTGHASRGGGHARLRE
jgi:hypothetical protein